MLKTTTKSTSHPPLSPTRATRNHHAIIRPEKESEKLKKYYSINDFLKSKAFQEKLVKLSNTDKQELLTFNQNLNRALQQNIQKLPDLSDTDCEELENSYDEKLSNTAEQLDNNTLSVKDFLKYQIKYITEQNITDLIKTEEAGRKQHKQNIDLAIRDMQRALKKLNIISRVNYTPSAEDTQKIVKDYLKAFLRVGYNNAAGSYPNISSAAMMLRFQKQDNSLSQKIAKHLALLTDISIQSEINTIKNIIKKYQDQDIQFNADPDTTPTQIEHLMKQYRDGNLDLNHDSAQKENLVKKYHHLLQKDGMAIIPFIVNIINPSAKHAIYGVLKRNIKGGLDLHIQNTWKQHKKVKVKIKGNTNHKKISKIINFTLQEIQYDCKYTKDKGAKDFFESLCLPHANEDGSDLYLKDICDHIEEDTRLPIGHQIQRNCHISGLHMALGLAAKLNAETPDESNIPKIEGLTPQTMARDVQKLDMAQGNRAAFYVLKKLRQNAKRQKIIKRKIYSDFLATLSPQKDQDCLNLIENPQMADLIRNLPQTYLAAFKEHVRNNQEFIALSTQEDAAESLKKLYPQQLITFMNFLKNSVKDHKANVPHSHPLYDMSVKQVLDRLCDLNKAQSTSKEH